MHESQLTLPFVTVNTTIRGSRLLATTILELLADEATWSELLEEYPSLEADDIRACLSYAVQLAQFTIQPLAA